jgi:hypothetical protein
VHELAGFIGDEGGIAPAVHGDQLNASAEQPAPSIELVYGQQ